MDWHVFVLIARSLVLENGHWRLPFGDQGEPCPWPFEPLEYAGAPIGMFHCSYCGSMVVVGLPHTDYRHPLPPRALV